MTHNNETRFVVRSVEALRRAVGAWRAAGRSVALVPTMGALHAGHIALIHHARTLCDEAVVSIFVNPKQFGPNEDFARYPRAEAADVQAAASAGAALIYAPTLDAMYPPGHATTVHVAGLDEGLCGAHRPGHFDGMALVVAKLFLQAGADVACFGEKDYQQLTIVRRLVADLDIPLRIEGVATVRAPDGLALSSRNAFLTVAERAIAPALHDVLRTTAAAIESGADVASQLTAGQAALAKAGFASMEYLELRDAASLAPLPSLTNSARLLAAVHLGRTRLIDNVALAPSLDRRMS